MIKIKTFVFNPFMENTYLVYDETGETLVIDPGCYQKEEEEELQKYIADNDLKVVRLINTHCHIDHVLGNQFIKDLYGVNLSIHKKDEETLRSVKVYAPNYGFQHFVESEQDDYLAEDDVVSFGNSQFKVMFVPGHAPGHIALYNEEEKIVIGGDVLFNGSIGRTDLPGGDFDTLINSIHTQLFKLGDDTVVYCGHGENTTIGAEKRSNPYCAIK
ncbi:MAG: MBL fold metallo-hydrolase [Cyclobacteriaceae bacterium]|nr:MBL fold metallo-hydrolase [Cyclobacteriaceae bacterium]